MVGKGSLPNPCHHTADEGQSQFSHAHILWYLTPVLANMVTSTLLPRQDAGSALLSVAVGEEQGQLPRLLQMAGGKEGRRLSFTQTTI